MKNIHRLTSSIASQLIKIIASVLITYIVTASSYSAELQLLDPETGLKIDKGYKTVDAYCIGCHRDRKIREHGTTREGWIIIVRKMQNIGQWKFDPKTERLIVEYLSKNYPQQSSGRK